MLLQPRAPGRRRAIGPRWAAYGAVAALTLAACGTSTNSTTADDSSSHTVHHPSSKSPSSHVVPAGGPMLHAQGFSFHAPKGWADVSDQARAGVLLYAAEATDEEPLMITVRHVTPGAQTVAAAQRAAKQLLVKAGASRIHTKPSITVGGHPTAHVVGDQSLHATHYQLDAYYVITGRSGWVLTFATDQYATSSHRDAMLASVLATCHWVSA
jgi:hypothetical protein